MLKTDDRGALGEEEGRASRRTGVKVDVGCARSIGVADLLSLSEGLVPEDEERCLASCPADMAKASQPTSSAID